MARTLALRRAVGVVAVATADEDAFVVAAHLSWNDCNSSDACCFIFTINGIASSLMDTRANIKARSNNGTFNAFHAVIRESSKDTFSRNRARASVSSPLLLPPT